MVTPLVRRPRTKPPVQLPARSEYDGRVGQSIQSILSEQPSFGFLRFGAGSIGWQYGGHVEEWRRCFAKHLERLISACMTTTDDVPDSLLDRLAQLKVTLPSDGDSHDVLSGIWKTLAVNGINVRRLPHLSCLGADCYELPFGLLMFVSHGERLSPTSAAREYAQGWIVHNGEWLPYSVVAPSTR